MMSEYAYSIFESYAILDGVSYRDDQITSDILCNPGTYMVHGIKAPKVMRCDYCGRKVKGDECKGCGAPVRE